MNVQPIIFATMKIMADKEIKKESRKLIKYLIELTVAVEKAVKALDAEMKKPSDYGRGQRIAQISNYLEYHKDSARHFGLGFKLKNKLKKETQ